VRCEATQFAVAAISQEDDTTYFVLIGRSHGKLGYFFIF